MSESQKTLLPTFIVYLNGTRFSVAQESSLKSIVITDRINLPSSCTIVLADNEKQWVDSEDFTEGALVSVHLGYKDHVDEVFNGEIVSAEFQLKKGSASTFTFRCMNTIHRLRRLRKHRIFSETTDKDIFSEVVSDNGLSIDIDDIGGDCAFMIQKDLTDHEFLLAGASRYGCKVWAKEKKVFFKKQNEEDSEEVILEWGKTLNEFVAKTDSTEILTEVNVVGWDNQKGESFTSTASYGDVQALGGSTYGGKMVEDNFGASICTITDSKVIDQTQADELALSVITENTYQYISGSGHCEGNNQIFAGNAITLKEVGGRFSGDYMVVEARHNFSAATGYTTFFKVSRNCY